MTKLEALEAIATFKPKVVVASWVTQLITEADELGTGSMYGVDEGALLRTGVTYVFVATRRSIGANGSWPSGTTATRYRFCAAKRSSRS